MCWILALGLMARMASASASASASVGVLARVVRSLTMAASGKMPSSWWSSKAIMALSLMTPPL